MLWMPPSSIARPRTSESYVGLAPEAVQAAVPSGLVHFVVTTSGELCPDRNAYATASWILGFVEFLGIELVAVQFTEGG